MNTIYLIVEGMKDVEIVRAILKHHHPHVRIHPLKPTGNRPNLSRLADQIERLIKDAIAMRKDGDCVAVLHDEDLMVRPNASDRGDYKKIERICRKYRKNVFHIVASDEIEAWLLADEGLCRWLKRRPTNCDYEKQPSIELSNALNAAGKPKFRVEQIEKILVHVDGTGVKFSPSLRQAFQHLQDAPCVKSRQA